MSENIEKRRGGALSNLGGKALAVAVDQGLEYTPLEQMLGGTSASKGA